MRWLLAGQGELLWLGFGLFWKVEAGLGLNVNICSL
jgi:hypothetical protein